MNLMHKSLGVSLLMVATAAFAHHGWSEYDTDKPLELSGTITQADTPTLMASSTSKPPTRPGPWCWHRPRAWKTAA